VQFLTPGRGIGDAEGDEPGVESGNTATEVEAAKLEFDRTFGFPRAEMREQVLDGVG